MRVAIFNFSNNINEVITFYKYLDILDKEIIDLHIDLFVNNKIKIDDKPRLIDEIIYIDTRFNLLLLKKKMDFYFELKRYDISIDLYNSFKSAYCSYFLTSRSAGFTKDSLSQKIISAMFYNEKIRYLKGNNDEKMVIKLFKKVFGF